ncbi:MAG: YggS family pyridoxal phosphate-dependent enzyme [Clostridiales bacterium]|nr:YggS family pyridoxal phosphate-dependent enzyme [Candidatus Crickella caballi]
MSIAERYKEIENRKNEAAKRCGRDPKEITLMAVTKTHTAAEINEAIDAGATDIGENRVQELLEKYDSVKTVRWHLIGHLQTNKVKNIIDKVVMIHSVDSLHLAEEINKRAAAAGIRMDILIEINSAMEATKSGIAAEELEKLVKVITTGLKNVRVCGIMCIPPMALEPEDARPYFKEAAELFAEMKTWDLPEENFAPTVLSMGMSGDFEVAVEEGSTIVRVGSSIFGPRNYR